MSIMQFIAIRSIQGTVVLVGTQVGSTINKGKNE
jgi:hypothetical protein